MGSPTLRTLQEPILLLRLALLSKIAGRWGVIFIERLEVNGVHLSFDLHEGNLNVNSFCTLLAIGELKKAGKLKADEPMPNQLQVQCTALYMTGKHREFSPILIDLDFRFNLDSIGRKYTLDHITKTIDIYIKELRKYVVYAEDIMVYVMEKGLAGNGP
jgi:hypothetical protein